MFAYVQYIDDGVKNIVHIKDIKNFDPKNTEDYSAVHAYWILWKGELFAGQILMLKDTSEEIEDILGAGKRIRVPKLLERNPVESQRNSERKEIEDTAMSQKASIIEGKRASLMEILKERQSQKRIQPLCASNSQSKRQRILLDDETSSGSDDELIAKSEFDELKKKHTVLGHKYQEAISELEQLRKLNTELQKCLVSKILPENNSLPDFMDTPQTIRQSNLSPPLNTPQATVVEISQQKEQASEEERTHIGEGIYINTNQWKRVQGNSKDSLFVKELAVCIWGTNILANRSLEGKSCPTTKTTPRPPLTPHKLRALKNCFQKWLETKNLEEFELRTRAGKFGRYVTEKIQDINKKQKKQNQ
ncbi:BEN domain-containing protein 5-like [Brachyhypopomus gauderio]|uniref:BEN domain-containing protein 5-like n=1 Tax=Brachyhypopomus gauderio TaxID=698409 RepID=UPI004042CFD4